MVAEAEKKRKVQRVCCMPGGWRRLVYGTMKLIVVGKGMGERGCGRC